MQVFGGFRKTLRDWFFVLVILASLVSPANTVYGNASNIRVSIKNTASGPVLLVNGKAVVPTLFFVNFDTSPSLRPNQLAEIKLAGKHGVNIVSFPVPMPWPRDGVTYDFAEVDARIEAAVKANPNVLIIPRIGVSWPPKWWCEQYPEELMLYNDGSRGIASIHSQIWRKTAAQHMAALIKHIESNYGKHILGYHPCGQNTGEWFFDATWEGRESGFEEPARSAFKAFLTLKYKSDANLQTAWAEPSVTLQTADVPNDEERRAQSGSFRRFPLAQKVFDFDEFRNEAMADIASYFCRVVKENAPSKAAVVFYGYHFELAGAPRGIQSTGHLALSRLLRSPYVDVVCSPVSYFDRGPGGGGYFMAPVDSVHLSGKLWLVEDDTRTHLATKDPSDPVVHMQDFEETKGVLARNFAHVVTRRAALWWMDLFGEGWFSTGEVWDFLEQLCRVYQSQMVVDKKYHPEIAVIVDEQSCLYLSRSGDLTNRLLALFRREWYRLGAPVGIYLLDDLIKGRVPPAKLYLFLDTFALNDQEVKQVRKHACKPGNVVVWMYAPGIVKDGSISTADIINLTGIEIKETSQGTGEIVLSDGSTFNAQHGHLEPSFVVIDPQAEVLARYASGNGVAVAFKKIGQWTSVYSSVLQLPASMLRELARRAGVHIYSDADDIVTAGNGVVGIHACGDGERRIKLPTRCRVSDCLSGGTLSVRSSECSIKMRKGETVLLRFGEEKR